MGKSVTLILREGEVPLIETDVIGVDAGAAYALRKQLNMICAMGDFDSIDAHALTLLKEKTQVISFPTHKDQPDSQLALDKALALGYDDIVIYGALGGRFDHHHANLILAYQHPEVTLIDDVHWIKCYGPGVYAIKKESHEKLSVFTLDFAVLSLMGVEYPLDHYEIDLKSILGLSNTWIEDEAILSVHTGKVLVYCTKA
ncbi:MAG: thiamine pyrophosphokinase [Erysipelotrichaceae bacterium]|nr:MAG: thiamine [Erysipelotrichaceae bacterium]TXT19042.1 MAG: thiamine pyrophosphokinase [Erysipelotrichaceae bacterium]